MQARPSSGEEEIPPVLDDLLELARRLRAADHLEPEVGAELADLLDELAGALDQPDPSAQADHLSRSTAHLVRSLHDQDEAGLVEAARRRLEDAAARAEAKAPVATGIARRLIAVLADLGI